MKRISRILILLICLLSCLNLTGQDLSKSLQNGSPQESKHSGLSVYLHTDRTYYLPGESILFKAYILDDLNNKSSSINDTLHTILLDQNGLQVASGVFPVSNSLISGKIELPDFLTEGNYILIAAIHLTNNISPALVFSRVIEIRESFDSDLITDLSLTDTVYQSGSPLTAQIRFSGKGNKPVPVSFTYQLTGTSGEIFKGKNKAGSNGNATLKLKLPVFDDKEKLKLLVIPSYKGTKTVTGVVIPTPFNYTEMKSRNERNISAKEIKHLNIQLKTIKMQNDKVRLDISVTDDKGMEIMANLSVSATNIFPHELSYPNDNFISFTSQKSNTTDTGSVQDIKKYYTQYLVQVTQSPGNQFIVQEKNNPKKLYRKEEPANQIKQEGYSAYRSIFDILMQIKPYHIDNGKITFSTNNYNSINNQDGALIIVDGIKRGTDASILNDIPVPDIAHISVSTNTMDIQRYSGMNNVGIIEITMKNSRNTLKKVESEIKNISNTLYWGPDIITDESGRASIIFLNNNLSFEILISAEGIAANGLPGSSTVIMQ